MKERDNHEGRTVSLAVKNKNGYHKGLLKKDSHRKSIQYLSESLGEKSYFNLLFDFGAARNAHTQAATIARPQAPRYILVPLKIAVEHHVIRRFHISRWPYGCFVVKMLQKALISVT